MVATFIIDWPVLAFFGFVFGNFSSLRPWWRDPALAGGLVAASGFTSVAMLSYRHAPDWMWMYYRDPKEMERFVPWMPVGYIATFVTAFVTSLRLRSEDRSVWPAAAAALGAEGAIVAATWDRYHRIGTKKEWENGTASELVEARPQGLAKKISSYGPIVAVTFLVGLLIARRGRASAADR